MDDMRTGQGAADADVTTGSPLSTNGTWAGKQQYLNAQVNLTFEALPGLPEPLPAGESIVWQGRPRALSMARQALWLDGIAVYFAALLLWRLAEGQLDGETAGTTALAMVRMLMPMSLAAA